MFLGTPLPSKRFLFLVWHGAAVGIDNVSMESIYFYWGYCFFYWTAPSYFY